MYLIASPNQDGSVTLGTWKEYDTDNRNEAINTFLLFDIYPEQPKTIYVSDGKNLHKNGNPFKISVLDLVYCDCLEIKGYRIVSN